MSASFKPPLPQMLTLREAADHLLVHERTLRRLVERGQLRAVKVNRALRFYPADLAAIVTPVVPKGNAQFGASKPGPNKAA